MVAETKLHIPSLTVSSAHLPTALEAVEYTLYRARHPDTGAPVLLRADLKQTPRTAARLRRELELREVLRPEWALRPLASVHGAGRTMLMLEDPGGELLNLAYLAPMSISHFLRTALHITGAVAEIHRSGLIHKDLKPDHIIIDTKDRVYITGFGFATYLSIERQISIPPEILAGTLAYIAPEQTGRLNQAPDMRSDLYSLGVIFFELLTARLPFYAADALEWIHCHVARAPPRLSEYVPGVPHVIDAIVARLLAKAPEERYQTANGLYDDLSRCLTYSREGRLDAFALGSLDVPTHLLVPQKVYGRQRELQELTSAVDRLLSQGKSEFLLISGHSGVGKSSLVGELQKYLLMKPALFASGKFDQFQTNVPYAAAAQAFQTLVRQILSTSAEEVAKWRKAFTGALGGSGQLIVNLVPDLEYIIGKQPPPPDLTAQDAATHFHRVFTRFLSTFATSEHPLILFFDDLQWLDIATLDLIERLASERTISRLLVVLAYRDNEVGSHHPLTGVLSRIRASEVSMRELPLSSLSRTEVEQIISDTLVPRRAAIAGVSDLVYRKAGGNPFFIRQFLSTLEEKGLIFFDQSKAAWNCDIERTRSMQFTDNVVDLMIEKLRRLPVATQAALGRLACLGNTATIATLLLLQGDAREDIHSVLRVAVKTGYIVRSETSYAFMHDRIHEAAHELIPASERMETHLRAARLMAAASAEMLAEQIFEIVSHFNRALNLLVETEEREAVARLNLSAARRSKAASAARTAIEYLEIAMSLLSQDAWERQYDLAFEIGFERAECAYLVGAMEDAERRLVQLAQRARGGVHAATVVSLRINLYTTLARMVDSVQIGLEYLRSVGTDLPSQPSAEDVELAYSALMELVSGGRVVKALERPQMVDLQGSATLDVLATMASPALFTNRELLQLVIAQMVAISIQRGNTAASALAYVWVGSILGSVFQKYQMGAELAQAGMQLLELQGFDRFKARTILVYGALVAPWTRPLSECRQILQRSLEFSLDVGDLSYASYAHIHIIHKMFGAGDSLHTLEQEAREVLRFVLRVRSGLIIPLLTGFLHVISMLRSSHAPELPSGVVGDLASLESDFDSNPQLAIAACWYWIVKLTACVHLGDHAGALVALGKARGLGWTSTGEFIIAEYHFYGALAYAAAWENASPERRGDLRAGFDELAAPLARWSTSCPETFSSRAALVAAEQARLDGNDMSAMRLYDQAIARSQEDNLIQIEALANERAARFYDGSGFTAIAELYVRQSHRCYSAWGAHGTVMGLERLYPQAFAEREDGGRSSLDVPVSQLDSFAIVRASQTVSREIVFPRLIETLVKQTIEHASVERGALILLRNGVPHIAADGRASQDGIQVKLRGEAEALSADDLPESGLRYVIRTRKRLIVDDVTSSDLLSSDPYVRRYAARSVFYAPIIKQANVIGALYLENTLAKNAFTPDRVTVLEFLASQAAISLENAYLYSELGRSAAFLAEAQRISHTGSWSWCVDTGEVRWSEEQFRLLAADPSDGQSPTLDGFFARVHPEDREALRKFVFAHVERGASFSMEFRILLPDGAVRFLHGVGRPKVGEDGEPLEYIGTTVDITDRKRADDALRDAQSDLMRAGRLATIGELTTSIAHEINQPLTAILANGTTCINWLSHDMPKIDHAKAAAQRVIESATRVGEIIDGIRAMARKDEPKMIPLELNDTIREIMVLLSSELRRRKVIVEIHYTEARLPIVGNRVQLQQVVVNLVMNAVEAVETVQSRRRLIRISTRCEEHEGALAEVSDTGIGMDDTTLSRIFEPLYTTKSGGLGIGLSMCRSIIAAHGGRISARSELGVGSSFTFSLPTAEGARCRE